MHNIKYFTGIFILIVSLFFISCEKEDTSIIDPVLNYPVIDTAYITPQIFDTSNVNLAAYATVTSIDPILRVFVTISDPNSLSLGEYELKDDGVFPDETSGDKIYSGAVNIILSCRLIGNYSVKFAAVSDQGLQSSQINETFEVKNTNNQPPYLTGFILTPDSAQFNQDVLLVFLGDAADPDGQCDLDRVFTRGIRPDNTLTSVLELYDDGNINSSGDTTAANGRYTRIGFGKPSQAGIWRYNLYAIDRSGDTSNILTDTLYVYP